MNWLMRMIGLGGRQGSDLSATVEYTVAPYSGDIYKWEVTGVIHYSDGHVGARSWDGGVREGGYTKWGAIYAAKRSARRTVANRRKSMAPRSKKTWTEKL